MNASARLTAVAGDRNHAMMDRSLRFAALIAILAGALAVPAVAGAASIHWNKAVRIEPSKDGGVSAVSCPTTTECLAVDASGNLIVSTKPTGGNGSWAPPAKIDPNGGGMTGISCPTVKLCVATDSGGDVVSSTDPLGGAKFWSRPVRADATAAAGGGSAGLTGISCPTVTLCVAVDGAATGNVVTSTNPTGAASSWKVSAVGGILTSVDCPSATFCVAAGTQHDISTNPTGGASAWKGTGAQAGAGVFSGIACPAVAFCVGVGYGDTSTGLATTSTTPKGAASAWTTVSVEPAPPTASSGLLDAVGCTSRSLCVAVDTFDNGYLSTSPASGTWTGGNAIRTTPVTSGNAISCTSAFCVVVDSAGVETTGVVR
jgi:hypothetical protein